MAQGTRFNMLVALKTTGQQGLKLMSNALGGVQTKLKGVQFAAAGAGLAMKTFAATAAIMAAYSLGRTIKGNINLADSFGKMSDQTGIAANTLMAYVNAGKLAGIEQQTIDRGLRRLAQSMREADQGVASYKDAFDALGISVRTSEGQFKTSEQVFGEIADQFRQMPDGARKAALAMEIFGRKGVDLINMLNNGSDALVEFNWNLSENFAQNSEYFNDQLTVMGIRAQGMGLTMTDTLLPALNASAEAFSDIFEETDSWVGFFTILEAGFRTVSAAVFATTAMFKFFGRTIVDVFKIAFNVVKFDFEEARRIMQEGLSDTSAQAGEDFQNLWKILTDSSEAPEEYTRSIEGLAAALDNAFGGSMSKKLEAFAAQMEDFGGMVADVVIKSFKGLEDQLVSFVTTGKMEFKKLAQSIIADMARIAIRASVIKPLMTAFGITANAKGNVYNQQGLVPFAKGGVVNSPHVFPFKNGIGLLGEAGSEAIMPLRRGPSGRLGVEAHGGVGANIVVNVDAQGTSVQGSDQEGRQLGKLIAAAVKGTIIQEQRPGGLLAA